jgi:GAF domain-containing protein
MSHYSTAQPNSTTESVSGSPGGAGVRLEQVKVAEQAGAAVEPGRGLVFPGEDRGQSLAEMAQRDLDAALQLLAERAQYITGATGAAIALRHEGEHDMLCRASAGTNAPELGALLSAEFGLSGESVRTRQPLRCDDAENDARVNRESCRALGIASVAVVPVVSDSEVLGVFELFSGQANAFGERDVAALERLAEMVETAARFARAAHGFPVMTDAVKEQGVKEQQVNEEAAEPQVLESGGDSSVGVVEESEVLAEEESGAANSVLDPTAMAPQVAAAEEAPVSKPLLWSATAAGEDVLHSDDSLSAESLPDYGNVPAALRALRKCEACGFPVSEGRRLCLDCEDEDKGRRGQMGRDRVRPSEQAVADASATAVLEIAEASVQGGSAAELAEEDVPILSVALESSPSWWAANKYVLGAIAVALLAVGAVVFLR